MSRNSHLSNDIFMVREMSHQDFVSRACKLNPNFFTIPGIWKEVKQDQDMKIIEPQEVLDYSFNDQKHNQSFDLNEGPFQK